jgi:hypothetical protein
VSVDRQPFSHQGSTAAAGAIAGAAVVISRDGRLNMLARRAGALAYTETLRGRDLGPRLTLGANRRDPGVPPCVLHRSDGPLPRSSDMF